MGENIKIMLVYFCFYVILKKIISEIMFIICWENSLNTIFLFVLNQNKGITMNCYKMFKNRGIKTMFKLASYVFLFSVFALNATPLFDVGVKTVQPAQLAVLNTSSQGLQIANSESGTPFYISLSGVSTGQAEIVIRNEADGKSVVLSGISSDCKGFELTPLMLAEMKESQLGEGNEYQWSLLEMSTNGDVRLVRSEQFSIDVSKVTLPVFNYSDGGVVKQTKSSERQLIGVGKMKPTVIVINPDDPEQMALAREKEEEMAYYIYIYRLPDQSLCTYDEVFLTSTQMQSITVGDDLEFNYTITGGSSAAQIATS